MSLYRQTSVESDGLSEGNDTLSVVSESFEHQGDLGNNSKSGLCGYLLKQSKEGEWQKRYFETNGMFLTYYKSKKMSKLLAALNMSTVGAINLVGNIEDNLGKGVVFQLELKDRNYTLRTKDLKDAERWINGLSKLRSDALENAIIVEESTDHDDHKQNGEDDCQPLRPVNVQLSHQTTQDEKNPHDQQDQDWMKNPERHNKCCIIL